jgi:Glycosidases
MWEWIRLANNLKIDFNSWSAAYRRPFGAVQAGKTVFFSVRVVSDQTPRVWLVVQKDGSPFTDQEMWADSDALFSFRFETENPAGLYFYHFKISIQDPQGREQTVYYGRAEDDYGGEGVASDSPDKIRQYQLTTYSSEDDAPEWYRHGVAYHIFVDRFCNGNRHHLIDNPKANSFIYATEQDNPYYIRNDKGDIVRWDYYGGNLKGIIEKLHYLKKLGVTILYLSPVFEANSNHKYNTADFRHIDPMFGDQRTFMKLVHTAGRMGMHLILDGVFNHVGADSIYFNRYRHYGDGGAANDRNSPYFPWFVFHHYPDSYESWWGVSDLPAVSKDVESYRDFIFKSKKSVVSEWTDTGIGGWRLDVADELPDDFIRGIREAVEQSTGTEEGKVLIGEVWEDASHKLAYGKRRHYLEGGMLHGVMNYPFRSLILEFLLQKISAQLFVRASLTLKSNYPPSAFAANFNNIGTHDTERVLTVLQGDVKKLRLAVWLLMTLPGVPCVYYGDEAGLTGGKDPDNRRFFPWGNIDENTEIYFHEAIHERRVNTCLQSGDYLPFYADKLLGFFRLLSEEHFTVIVFNPTQEAQSFSTDQLNDETGDKQITRMALHAFHEKVIVQPLDFTVVSVHSG